MNSLIFKTAGLIIFMVVLSCSGNNKQEQLTALRKKHDAIAEQIKQLETEVAGSDTTMVAETNSPKIAVTELVPTVFNHFIEVQGKLDGEDNLGVNARIPGTVEEVFVHVGDKVKKGQVLAKLDESILQQSLKQEKDNQVYVNDLFERQKNLWDQKIGSEVQYLKAKNDKESLENRIISIQDQINMMRIVSPINGTVEEVAIKVGQSVQPGSPVLRVVNFNSLKVVAEVAESYSSMVHVGDEVILYFPDLQKEIPAKISSASKYISALNRTFQIEVRIKPEYDNFKANMIVILKIKDYSAKNAIMLPINILQNDKEGSFVFVAEKSNLSYIAKKYHVKVGQSYNGMVEIKDGLTPGALLISAGQIDLQDGQAIRL